MSALVTLLAFAIGCSAGIAAWWFLSGVLVRRIIKREAGE